jgi:hypothetical protein
VAAAWRSAALCVLVVLACGREQATIPGDLLGRWVSDDPAYAGRSLSISSRSLVFASSRTASDTYAVREVEAHPESDGSRTVLIAYGTADPPLTLRVHRFATDPPSITLGDRPERWLLEDPREARP